MDVARRSGPRATAVAAVLALVAVASSAAAAPGSPAPQPPLASGLVVADAPLVADAGDSAFVQRGKHVVLYGTSFGGAPPATYAWTAEAGTVQVPDNATAVIPTSDVEPGTYTATLTATDGAGTTATDTVTYVVFEPRTEVLFDEAGITNLPGLVAVAFFARRTFHVPSDTPRIVADLTFTEELSDYEVRLVDPDGNEATRDNPPPGEAPHVSVQQPAVGQWTAEILRWTPFPDEAHLIVSSVTTEDEDPRTRVDAGGPYEFLVGDEQRLTSTMEGGAGVTAGWDLDLDGVFEVGGQEVVADLPRGRHLVSFKATTADGHETREMTSVLVGTAQELDELSTPLTVIGFADTGINPYHLEFSAAAYPDPEVLELTRNFTRHPSEYIPGYPEDAVALPISRGQGYFPDQDTYLWDRDSGYVEPGRLHWIPGTKIIGAIDAGGTSGSVHPILDDNGHGSGSASVAAGNRYGYCPTCLIVTADSLAGGTNALAPLHWLDLSSNSWGYRGGLPVGTLFGAHEATRAAAERGQTTLFAAGNGIGNTFFDVPILTYGSDVAGPDWNIVVGAIREDSQGAIISDGVPAHVSNLGDGDLPSACGVGDTGQCAFGGTSAATPYTAGVFGHVLTAIRDALGDHSHPGQRSGQVIAEGTPIPGSPFLDDGRLTRRELRAAVLKTAAPRYDGEQAGRFYPLPQQWNLEPAHYVFEGYGSPGPAAAERAIEVLLGLRALPDRTEVDTFFLGDCEARDLQYGSYDRTGDGQADFCDESASAVFTGDGSLTNDDPRSDDFDAARDAIAQDTAATEPITYWLHRRPVYAPDAPPGADPVEDQPFEDTHPCGEGHNEQYLDRHDASGDVGTCFDARITSVVAAYRPKGIFAAKDLLTAPLPAGSTVDVTAYLKSHEPGVTELVAVLKATDREVGRSARVTLPTHPADWTKFQLDFTTDRPIAAGEQLSFQFVHLGSRAWAIGYEDDYASHLTIIPAPMPTNGLEFGVTIDEPRRRAVARDGVVTVAGRVAFPALGDDEQLAGFHAVDHAVQVAVDDPDFLRPRYAVVDPDAGTYSVDLDLAGFPKGPHTVYVRPLRDRFPGKVATVDLTVAGPRDGARGGGPADPPRGSPDAAGRDGGPPSHVPQTGLADPSVGLEPVGASTTGPSAPAAFVLAAVIGLWFVAAARGRRHIG